MLKFYGIIATIILLPSFIYSQEDSEELPFREVSDYPESFTAETVLTRLIESLGFRFYWATERINEEDLPFKPSENGRSFSETVDHIYGLSNMILHSVLSTPNTAASVELTFEEKRKAVLLNLQQAVDVLNNGKKLEDMKTVFSGNSGSSEFPFWNQINGPISDAIWHCGQLVVLRRAAGNPLPSGPSFFNGKVRD